MALANNILNQFKNHPDAWLTVDKILEKSQSPNGKFLALSILDEAINVSNHLTISKGFLIFVNKNPVFYILIRNILSQIKLQALIQSN